MIKDFSGLTAIITGASSGIGLHIAQRLAAEKANLVLAARSADKLDSLAESLQDKFGIKAMAVPTDVTDQQQLHHLVHEAISHFGIIDLLFNNAGIETYYPFEEIAIDQLNKTIETNLTSALILSRLVVPIMLKQRSGHIVNISSTAGKHGPAFGAAYGISKAGLISLTQSLRAEYRDRGISASVICPGFTNEGGIYERMKKQLGRGTPPLMGTASMKSVTNAVIKAIKQDKPESIINWPPMRPVFAISQLWPRWGEQLIRWGSFRFLRRVAKSRAEADLQLAARRKVA